MENLNLITEITELNGVIGANWLFEKIKEKVPNAYFLDMGYEGGYSPRLVKGVLSDYNGHEYIGPESLDELATPGGEIAFGNIVMEAIDNCYQLYHNTREFILEDSNGFVAAYKDARTAFKQINDELFDSPIFKTRKMIA